MEEVCNICLHNSRHAETRVLNPPGWVIGALDDDASFIQKVVADCHCIGIDIDYRLAPEYKYPIPITDCRDVFKHLSQDSIAQELGIDRSKMAVGGFSAGGHISALISQMARDQEWEYKPCFQLLVIPVCDASALGTDLQPRKGEHTPQINGSTASIDFRAFVADSPYRSWTEHYNCPFLNHARMSWFYKYFLPSNPTDELLRSASLSPIQASSLANLPPALIVPAEVDALRDEGIAYAHRLKKENPSGWNELWLAKGVPHPFPHQTKATDIAVQFEELACKRLKEAFEGRLEPGTWISNID
jgi:acetyl esterase/lipase